MDPLADIRTPRLVLRLMRDEVIAACLARRLDHAQRLLGAAIAADVLDRPTSLEFARARLAEDPQYQPWSMRAIILPGEAAMIGHIRFHSRPDPDYLRGYARDAVELGYFVFPVHRRRGYATEAATAMMAWAEAAFGVRHFIASVAPDNAPSLRVVARLEFSQVGTQQDEIDGPELVFLRTRRASENDE